MYRPWVKRVLHRERIGQRFSSDFRSNFELKEGVAKTSVVLPDNLTSFRVMAVVVTTGDKFGSGEATAVVNKPVMALPALPRLARVGDSFEAGVTA